MIINDVNSIMRWQTKLLPDGYTELEWLQGDGNTTASCPFINLGFYFDKSQNFRIEIDGQLTTIRERNHFFGRYSNGWRAFIGSSNTKFQFGIGNVIMPVNCDLSRHLFAIDKNELKWYLDNQSGALSNNNSASSTTTYWLFGFNYDGNPSNVNARYSNIRIYDFKAYLNGLLYSHCIPVMRDSDSAAGMYDVVRNQFLTNAGTGTFTYG